MRKIAMATVVLAALAGSASAQSQSSSPSSPTLSPPRTEGRSTIPEAPIGHRQPTMRDLPPAVRREESGDVPTSSERRLDQELQICRGC